MPISGRLDNKVAIGPGAASGIGEATARLFAREGASVVAVDMNADALQAVTGEIIADGGACRAVPGDVADRGQTEDICHKAVEQFGHLDTLVNSAGITRRDVSPEADVEAAWEAVMRVNLKGTMLMCHAAVARMRDAGGGAIINLASVMSHVVHPGSLGLSDGFNPYPQSKGGVLQLTRDLGVNLAWEGIRVNAVCPGFVDTYLTRGIAADAALYEKVADLHPMGRFARPAEIANVVLFLASDEASFVTAAAWAVDGGYTAI